MADSTTQEQESKPVKDQEDSLYGRVKTFFQKLAAEWEKISFPDHHWPKGDQWENSNRGELWRMSIGVFVFTIIVTLIVMGFSVVVEPIFTFLENLV